MKARLTNQNEELNKNVNAECFADVQYSIFNTVLLAIYVFIYTCSCIDIQFYSCALNACKNRLDKVSQ